MIYVDTGTDDVFRNFGCEVFFATERDLGEPVFLLWSTTPTLMIGKYQNAYEEINLPYAEAHGLTLVRRLSGGGTIYTDPGGFQYSFIVRESGEEISFERFMEPVVAALRTMGLPAEKSGRNDILVAGKKVSGNAQYRLHGATVHHGSLLFDTDLEELVRATTPKEYKITSKSIRSVRERVTNIREHLPQDCTPAAFHARLVAMLAGEEKTYRPTAAEWDRIDALGAQFFRDTVFTAQPKFSMERILHTAGGCFEFTLEVKKNRITDVSLQGDFFGSVSTAEICDLLRDVSFTEEDVCAALLPLNGRLFGTTPAELAHGLTRM